MTRFLRCHPWLPVVLLMFCGISVPLRAQDTTRRTIEESRADLEVANMEVRSEVERILGHAHVLVTDAGAEVIVTIDYDYHFPRPELLARYVAVSVLISRWVEPDPIALTYCHVTFHQHEDSYRTYEVLVRKSSYNDVHEARSEQSRVQKLLEEKPHRAKSKGHGSVLELTELPQPL